uniref:Ig-like domain-containing protein n=1 Tax=Caenorhabditis japonica TaxID=281687 RepID=A0A8R1IKR9_CAEJA
MEMEYGKGGGPHFTTYRTYYIIRTVHLDGFDESDESVQYEVTTGVGRHFVLRRPSLLASRNLDISYSWYRNSNQVTPDATHFVTADGDLVVTGVKTGDFGTYKLMASSNDLTEIVSKEYTVNDNGLSPPLQNSVSIIYFPTDRTIIETLMPHDEVFDCVTSLGSKDDVRIRWFLNNQVISGSEVGMATSLNGRRLVISNPSGFTRGEHKLECRAETAMGRSSDQKAIYLTFISRPVLKELAKEVHRTVGSNLSLKCGVKRKNPSDIKWYKNGLM